MSIERVIELTYISAIDSLTYKPLQKSKSHMVCYNPYMFLLALYKSMSARARRILIFLALMSFIIGVGSSTIFRAGFDVKIRTDLSIYRAAAQGALEGKNIYWIENERTWYFTSPPVVAILCIPLTWMPLVWGAVLVYVVSIFLLAGTVALLVRLMPPRLEQQKWKIAGLSFVASSIFFSDVLTRGQFGILVLFSLTLTLYGWLRGKPFLAGTALGFAIAIKIIPAALLLPFFILKRELRIAGWAAASGLFFTLIPPAAFFGWAQTLAYLKTWLLRVPLSAFHVPPDMEEFYLDNFKFWRQIHDPFIFRNQSLFSVLARLTIPSRDELIVRGNLFPRLVSLAISTVMCTVSFWTLVRERKTDWEKMFEFSIPIIVLLVSSTLAWTHYFSVLFLPLFFLLIAAFDPETTAKTKRMFIGTFTLCAAMIFLGYAVKPLQSAGFILWATMIVWAGMVWALGKDRRGAPACAPVDLGRADT